MSSLYEQLGGEPAVDAAVDIFYKKVISDPRVNGFFKGVDMAHQSKAQKKFLTMVFGGPANYSGRNMRKAHERLATEGVDGVKLNDTHFDVIVELLGATLKELGVGDAQIQEVAKIAESVRDDVLGRPVAS